MVGVEDKKFVERIFYDGIHLVRRSRQPKHHLEEVAAVAQVVRGVDRRVPHVVLVRLRSQCRQLGDEAVHGPLNVDDGPVGVLRFRIERAEARDHRTQHPHWVSTLRKRLEEAIHILVHQRVVGNAILERIELLRRGQLSINQEKSDLKKGCVFRELINAVATVMQDAILAVEKCDGALGRSRVFVAQIQGDIPCLTPQVGDVDGLLVLASRDYGEFVFLAFQDDARCLSSVRLQHGESNIVLTRALYCPTAPTIRQKNECFQRAGRWGESECGLKSVPILFPLGL